MKKLFYAVALASASIALPSCDLPPPGQLQQTTVDEKAYLTALLAFDTFVESVDSLIDAGVIVPGSPRAVALADAIDKARGAFAVASKALDAGVAQDYVTAMREAADALRMAGALLKGEEND